MTNRLIRWVTLITLFTISLTANATHNNSLKSFNQTTTPTDSLILKNYNTLCKQTSDPTVLTNYLNQHIQEVTNKEAYTMVKSLVTQLKTYQQHLYQKLDDPFTQQQLLTQFKESIQPSKIKTVEPLSLRHFLQNEIYNKGFSLTLTHDQYLPIINEKELEKYYLFLTPAQIQHIRILLNR